MVRSTLLSTSLAIICLTAPISSAELDEADTSTSMLIRRGKRTSTYVDTAIRDSDPSPLDQPTAEHDVMRNLQTSSCGGNNMMCGCSDVRQTDYRGHFMVSQNGFRCAEWSMAADYPNQGLEDGPYCRNPHGVGERAWCFVENASVMWDYCNVAMCQVESSQEGCLNTARYNDIYADIDAIRNSIRDDGERSHFLGGIVRLGEYNVLMLVIRQRTS